MPATKQVPPTPAASVPRTPAPIRRASKSNKAADCASALRKLLIMRGEKLVFAGCIVGCLVFFGLSLKHLPYSKSPEALKAEATKVLNDLESTKSVATLTKKLPKGPDVKSLKSLGEKKADARAYALGPLRMPFQNRQLRRGEPRILPVERLLASAGYGPIAIQGAAPTPPPPRPAVKSEVKPADAAKEALDRRKKLLEDKKNKGRARPQAKTAKEEKKPAEQPVTPKAPEQEKEKALLAQAPAGSHVEMRNWVCLVAAIPHLAQLDEYQRAFHEALFRSADRDQPRYALPQIERAEVIGGRQLRWRPVNVIAALEDQATWAADYPDSTDSRLVDPELTGLLPPLVSTNFDPAKIGHPQVKVVVVKKPKPVKENSAADAKEATRDTAVEPKKPAAFIGGLRDKKPAAKETPPTAQAKPADAKAVSDKPPEPPPIEIVRYRLFRFFDFDVEPGVVYRYRVKLVALNPNYEVPARFLATPEMAEDLFREGAWSSPSSAVAVTEGTRLLAGSVAPGGLATNDTPINQAADDQDSDMVAPLAKILIHYFDFAMSRGVNVLVDAGRGSLLNQANVALTPVESSAAPSAKKKGAGAATSEGAPELTLDVLTDAVVVDLFGGDELPGVRDRSIPGHVLVLDRYGTYKTLLQANDAPTFEKDLPTVASSPAAGKPSAEQARK